jgi:HAD superfamily hydrolase (TIGR01509 family)
LVNNDLKAALLDIDGTLVDSNDAHAHAWVEAFKRGGYDVPFEKVRPLIGMGADNLIPEVVGISKETEKGEQLSKWWEEAFKEKYLPRLKPFPKVRELLMRMREGGLKLVAASSSKEELLEKLLEITGAKDLFQEDTSADDAEKSKPDPDIVHAALEKAGVPPDEALMLGDSPYDVEASGKAGVGMVALRCGGFSDEELKGALAIYDDPADLLEHYEESPFAAKADVVAGV